MRESFHIGGAVLPPKTRTTVEIGLSRLADHTEMTLRAHVIHGKEEGPTVFVSGAIHGDEIIGVEIIRRISRLKALSRVRGTLILIPVVNTFGFLALSRYLPDRRDLNRCFPGIENGSPASQLAHTFMTQIVAPSDYGLDLHSGAIHRSNLPQIRANLDDDSVRDMAQAFGAPVMLNSNLRDGSLRQSAQDVGCNMLLYEAGEALRFDENSIRIGVQGVVGVLQQVGMLPKAKKSKKPRHESVQAHSSHWLRAPMSGILRTKKALGATVKKGEVIAVVSDPLGLAEEHVLARHAGLVIGVTNLPVVNRGDALFHVARFDDLADVEGAMEEMDAENDPLFDGREVT